MLKSYLYHNLSEAGCDEAGRGCLAGPVVAAAVILPKNYTHLILNDSKKLTARQRETLREEIISSALSWGIGVVDNNEIDEINILRASIKAMHLAVGNLKLKPQFLLIDGNRFFHKYMLIACHGFEEMLRSEFWRCTKKYNIQIVDCHQFLVTIKSGNAVLIRNREVECGKPCFTFIPFLLEYVGQCYDLKIRTRTDKVDCRTCSSCSAANKAGFQFLSLRGTCKNRWQTLS